MISDCTAALLVHLHLRHDLPSRAVSLALKFYNQDNEDFAMSLWKDNLLDYSAQVSLEGQAIWEIERGLKLGSKLEVCTASSFNHHRMASFAVGVTSMRQFAVVT